MPGAVDDLGLEVPNGLEVERQVVHPRQQGPDLPVGPSPGTVGVELVEDFYDVKRFPLVLSVHKYR